jgi:tol-pal system protein YbgF
VVELEKRAARVEPKQGNRAGPRETPKLPVVRLAPRPSEFAPRGDDAGGYREDANDRRPAIRITNDNDGGDVSLNLPVARGGAALGDGPGSPQDARRTYDAAVADVRARKFAAAREAFAAFLVRFPDHPLVANATFWRGECFFAEGDFTRAAEHFEGVLARFPQGAKASDALFKLGTIQQRKGDTQKARTYWDRLKINFPGSAAAKQIPRSEGS